MASPRSVLRPYHQRLLLDQPSIRILLEGEVDNRGSVRYRSKSIHNRAWQRVDRQIPDEDGGDGRIVGHACYRWMRDNPCHLKSIDNMQPAVTETSHLQLDDLGIST